MKNGLLERGWKYIATGSILLFVSAWGFAASFVFPGLSPVDPTDIGMVIVMVGTFYLILGVRAQYKVWHIDAEPEKRADAAPEIRKK